MEEMEYTIDEMNRKLKKYVKKYNFIRPHGSLGYKTPIEIVYGM